MHVQLGSPSSLLLTLHMLDVPFFVLFAPLCGRAISGDLAEFTLFASSATYHGEVPGLT